MAFNDHFGSDNFRFGFGGGDRYENMHDSKFLSLNSAAAFDLHHSHENVFLKPNPSANFQWSGNTSYSRTTSTLNGFNHPFDGTTMVTHQQVTFGADGRHFTTTAAVEHPPATFRHDQFGVVVQRHVVETVTYRPIQPPPHRVSYTTSPYHHPKLEDIDNYDIKPHLRRFPPPPALPLPLPPPPPLPQNNNNNNSVCSLQIQGPKKTTPDHEDDDNNKKDNRNNDFMSHKKRMDEHKTRSLKHKKYGPYTCPRCERKIGTSQSFASHMRSHYNTETEEERKKRMEAKYKKKNLRVAVSGDGLTLVPQKMDWNS